MTLKGALADQVNLESLGMSSIPDPEAKENLKNQALAAFYFRHPGAFDNLKQTFSELFSIARQYAEAKSYDLTQRALFAISDLLDKYLALRSGNLSVPTSTMAMTGLTNLTFDALLIEELESFVGLANSATSRKDRQTSQQVFDAMGVVALRSLEYKALFEDHGSNPTTSVIYGHIYSAAQEAVRQQFDDGVLAGLRTLREIAKAGTSKNLYLTVATIGGNIEAVSLVSSALKKQVIVAEGMQALMEILDSEVRNSRLYGSHTIDTLLDAANAIARQEIQMDEPGLASSLYVQQTVGPFLGLVHPTSLAHTYEFAVASYYSSLKKRDRDSTAHFQSVIEQLDDWNWARLRDVGELAAKKQSFVIFFLNSTVSTIVNAALSLWAELAKIEISGDTPEEWQDRYSKDKFRKDLLDNMVRTISHVYWKLTQGFPDQISTNHIWELPPTLSQIGIRAVVLRTPELPDSAMSAIKGLSVLSVTKSVDKNPYAPPRFAEYIARIGIVALQEQETKVVEASLARLKECQTAYAEKINSSEGLHPESRRELLGRLVLDIRRLEREFREQRFRFDADEIAFYQAAKPEYIGRFVALLQNHLGPELS
jgi:hypothetical protein